MEQPGLKGKVKESWGAVVDSGWKGYTLPRKLARVRRMISLWNKKSFGDVNAKLNKSRVEWERLRTLQDSRSLSVEEELRLLALQKVIWLLEDQDERIWRQKARIKWLRLGDQNTNYFHRMAMWRSKKNNLSSILANGSRIEDPGLIKQAAREYFAVIFRRSEPCLWALDELFSGTLNEEQRSFLERDISKEEILCVLKECDGNKAPGPDGFNINFYKKILVDSSGGGGGFHYGVLQEWEAFQSLVNSMYKILSKCLAKRLSSVLPQIISPNQSTFLTDRNILDGIMIINDIIHAVKKERRAALVIKLEFKKAYDSVSWEYLRSIHESLGFGAKWMDWMFECVSTARLSIVINGSPSQEFPMERGLRQGDPLSPFLFLLAAEGLSMILNKAVNSGLISGVEWVRNGASLTHLQFADDTVLFCRPEMEEVRMIKKLLTSFAVCSGLEINFSKSRCLVIGLEEEEIQGFAKVLGCPTSRLPLNYLGLQVGASPGRLNTWRPVLQKFKDKLSSWKSTSLSMAGRVVLIKAALSNLPLYYASIFKMPAAVALEMEKIQRRFLWESSEARRKIHFVKWAKISKPKQYGGLGIQGMVDKNLVQLAKWWWKLVSGKGGLWRRMILEKYTIKRAYDSSEVLSMPKKLSTCWKDIIKSVQGKSEVALTFKKGVKLKLGNGKTISFWYDIWLGDKPVKDQYPKLFLLALDSQATVRGMGSWVGGIWLWQLSFRRTLYPWEEVYKRELEMGLKHVWLKSEADDRMVWSFSSDGNFSTNTLKRAAMEIRRRKKKWDLVSFQLWSGLAPLKVEMFVWRVYLNSLPTKMTLKGRRVLSKEEDLACVLCGTELETADHMLMHCQDMSQVKKKEVKNKFELSSIKALDREGSLFLYYQCIVLNVISSPGIKRLTSCNGVIGGSAIGNMGTTFLLGPRRSGEPCHAIPTGPRASKLFGWAEGSTVGGLQPRFSQPYGQGVSYIPYGCWWELNSSPFNTYLVRRSGEPCHAIPTGPRASKLFGWAKGSTVGGLQPSPPIHASASFSGTSRVSDGSDPEGFSYAQIQIQLVFCGV
ncbi:hypothetical protein QQ045_011623 [Rhodiola kirilowii]